MSSPAMPISDVTTIRKPGFRPPPGLENELIPPPGFEHSFRSCAQADADAGDALSSCSTADTAEALSEVRQDEWPTMTAAAMTDPARRSPAYVPGRVLRCAARDSFTAPIVLALEECVESSVPALPSKGSWGHACGLCQPCEFFHRDRCTAGTDCRFCHLCGPEEPKLRRKAKRLMKRMEGAVCQNMRCGGRC